MVKGVAEMLHLSFFIKKKCKFVKKNKSNWKES